MSTNKTKKSMIRWLFCPRAFCAPQKGQGELSWMARLPILSLLPSRARLATGRLFFRQRAARRRRSRPRARAACRAAALVTDGTSSGWLAITQWFSDVSPPMVAARVSDMQRIAINLDILQTAPTFIRLLF